MANNRRPQAPKRRNYVAKNMNKFNRPQTHRDRTQYNRYEDYLKDQLDGMVNDEVDDEIEAETKKKFVAAIAGEEYDPDRKNDYYEWLMKDDESNEAGYFDEYDYDDESAWDYYDYD